MLNIVWRLDPVIGNFLGVAITWDVVIFMIGFFLAFLAFRKVFRKEEIPMKHFDKLLLLIFIGLILDFRMVHLLDNWEKGSTNIFHFFKFWEGGLINRGGAIGIALGGLVFALFVVKKPILWVADRFSWPVAILAVALALAGFMNPHIIGAPTDLPWAIVRTDIDRVARHPWHLYDALSALIALGTVWYFYFKRPEFLIRQGFIFGVFLTVINLGIFMALSTHDQEMEGQGLLADVLEVIPLLIIGIILLIRSVRPSKPESKTVQS